MSETAPREVGSARRSASPAVVGSPSGPGRREVSPDHPGIPPLAATPATRRSQRVAALVETVVAGATLAAQIAAGAPASPRRTRILAELARYQSTHYGHAGPRHAFPPDTPERETARLAEIIEANHKA